MNGIASPLPGSIATISFIMYQSILLGYVKGYKKNSEEFCVIRFRAMHPIKFIKNFTHILIIHFTLTHYNTKIKRGEILVPLDYH